MVGNDRDEHGCIGSAGYSWCEDLWECVQPWETKCESLMGSEENKSVVEDDLNKNDENVVEEQSEKNITEDWNVMSEWVDVDLETENISKIYSVLEDIKDYGEAEFGEIIPTSIVWRTKSDKFNVDAYGIEVLNSDKLDMTDMEKFFVNNGWTSNLLNMADWTAESMEWFEKDGMGCLVFWKMSDGVNIKNHNDWKSDISVKCGVVE